MEGYGGVLNLLLRELPISQLQFRDSENCLPLDVAANENITNIITTFQNLNIDSCYNKIIHKLSGGATKYPNWKPATAFYVGILFYSFHLFAIFHIYFMFESQFSQICLFLFIALLFFIVYR
eukprot:UN05537